MLTAVPDAARSLPAQMPDSLTCHPPPTGICYSKGTHIVRIEVAGQPKFEKQNKDRSVAVGICKKQVKKVWTLMSLRQRTLFEPWFPELAARHADEVAKRHVADAKKAFKARKNNHDGAAGRRALKRPRTQPSSD